VQADQRSYDLTQARFQHGVASMLTVLAAEQTVDGARQNLIQLRYSRLFNLINIYQDLGGGWREDSLPLPENGPSNGD